MSAIKLVFAESSNDGAFAYSLVSHKHYFILRCVGSLGGETDRVLSFAHVLDYTILSDLTAYSQSQLIISFNIYIEY